MHVSCKMNRKQKGMNELQLVKNNFFYLFRWQMLRMKHVFPLYVIVQTLLAVGIVLGFSYLIPSIDNTATLYLTTGAPTVILLAIGLVFLPQGIAETRLDGTLTYMLSLPIRRLYYVLVESVIWFIIALPGIIIALFVAMLHFDIRLSFSFISLFAFSLVGLTAIGIGYTISLWLQPTVAELISQVLIFGILLFSPVNFPKERLPEWLQLVHDILPIQYMAEIIRASIAEEQFSATFSSYMIVIIWFVVSFILCYIAISRRT